MRDKLMLVAVIIMLTAICVLAVKDCSERRRITAPPTFTQVQIDSMKSVQDALQKEVDKYSELTSYLATVADSFDIAHREASTELEIQTLKVKALTREAQLAQAKRDKEGDGKYVAACDSLLPEVDRLIEESDSYRLLSRQAMNSYDSLLGTTSLLIGRLEFQNEFCREKFDNLSAYSLDLEKKKAVSDKKAARRFGIGPYIGVTYDGSNIKPSAGAAVFYQLIRF